MAPFQSPTGAAIRIDADPAAMAEAFAADLADAIARRLADAPFFALALTGGKTPAPLYAKLLEPGYASRVDWKRVKVFFGDERTVPPDHADSNYRMAREAWLGKGAVPAGNIFRMKGEGIEGDFAKAAAGYSEILRREAPASSSGFPALDLVLLGMGDDGHVASLFPGTAALNETQAIAVANAVPQQKTTRLTLTFPAINAARAVWMLVSGAGKAERAAEALGYRPGGEKLPVSRVRPASGMPLWRLDPAAAGLIPRSGQ